MRYLIDTNIWIAFFQKNPKVGQRLRDVLAQGHEVCLIPVVYYEFIRGVRYTNDLEFLHNVTQFWRMLPYQETTKLIWDEATRLWARAKRQNQIPGDKDILIAAFAIQLEATIVTRNVRHFQVFDIPIENWIDD